MGKIFQDLWIMSEEEIVLLSRVFDPKVDDQLFGGLMSALNTFAESLSDGGLSNFELSDKRFTLMKMNKLLFVANASLTVKDKKLRGEIQKFAEKFFTKYPENFIRDWNYDISAFYDFEKEIENILKSPMEKFWNGF